MNVTWYPDDGVAVVLADDSLQAGPYSKKCLDSWPEHSQLLQTVPRVRAANVNNYGRSNVSVVYHLRTLVEFQTVDECMTYRDDIMAQMVGRGTIEIGYDAGSFRTVYGAVCSNISFSERYGVSTVVEFTFIGEQIAR